MLERIIFKFLWKEQVPVMGDISAVNRTGRTGQSECKEVQTSDQAVTILDTLPKLQLVSFTELQSCVKKGPRQGEWNLGCCLLRNTLTSLVMQSLEHQLSCSIED